MKNLTIMMPDDVDMEDRLQVPGMRVDSITVDTVLARVILSILDQAMEEEDQRAVIQVANLRPYSRTT